jgi:hypothetical protein
VVEATAAAGPERLAERARRRFEQGGLEAVVLGWLVGEEQPPLERYLARAGVTPVLEAVGDRLPPPPGDRAQPHGVVAMSGSISPGTAYGFLADTGICIGCDACEVAGQRPARCRRASPRRTSSSACWRCVP